MRGYLIFTFICFLQILGKIFLEVSNKTEIVITVNPKTKFDDFYMLNEMYELTCQAQSLSEIKLSWWWKECKSWQVCSNDYDNIVEIIENKSISNIINIKETKFNNSKKIVSSVLNIKAEQSGKYFCNASNELLIYEIRSILFIVTDVKNGIEVYPSNNKPVNDDEISITCKFSNFLYTNVSWSHIAVPSYELFPIDNSIYYEREDEEVSDYTNSSVIKFHIKNVQTGLYVCNVKNKQFNNYTEKFAAVYLKAENDISADSPKDRKNTSIIVIIVVTILFSIILIIGIIAIFMIKRKRKFSRYNSFLFKSGQVNLLNPELPIEDQVDLLPYDSRWEFPKDRLKLGRVLGHGAFGRVIKAEAIGLKQDVPFTTVAVKVLKERDDDSQYKALMAELKILIHLGKHVNILNLLGAVTKNLYKGELMVIVEYCCHGNLRSYLLRHRQKFVNQIDPITGKIDSDIWNRVSQFPNPKLKYEEYTKPIGLGISNPTYNYSSTGKLINSQGEICTDMTTLSNSSSTMMSESGYSSTGDSSQMHANMSNQDESRYSEIISTSDLLCYSFQCAQGMSYLSSRKLIHRDLAARNILLAEGNVIKIADFGLAKDLYKYSKYVKKADGPLPIKWMAIESIKDRIFTTKSDVWSFGVLLWEIFTLGGNPYPGFEMNEQFLKRLKDGYRMEKPEYASTNIYEIMMDCWHENPNERPDFAVLGNKFGNMLEYNVKQYYLDLNSPYMEENQNLASVDYLTMTTHQADYLKMETNTQNINQPEYLNFPNTSTENQSSSEKELQVNNSASMTMLNDDKTHISHFSNKEISVPAENEKSVYAKIRPQNTKL